jgi:hypothetical protein
MKTILVITDFSTYLLYVQKVAASIARKINAKLYLVLNYILSSADLSDEINADLIAIETHGRTGISHLISGSLAKNLATHIYRPVLSIKMRDIPEYRLKPVGYPKSFEN